MARYSANSRAPSVKIDESLDPLIDSQNITLELLSPLFQLVAIQSIGNGHGCAKH